jgi:putative DNA primase/helicase
VTEGSTDPADTIASIVSDAELIALAEEWSRQSEGTDLPPPAPPAEEGAASPSAGPPGRDRGADHVFAWRMLRRCAREPETDIGNARRMLIRHGRELIRVEGLGWAVFDGKRWVQDFFDAHVRPLAHGAAEMIRHEACTFLPSDEERGRSDAWAVNEDRWRELTSKGRGRTPEENVELGALTELAVLAEGAKEALAKRRDGRRRYGKTSCNSGKLDNMLQEAGVYVTRSVASFDRDPLALNCENGTLRLIKVGEGKKSAWTIRLDRHRREDFLSKLVPVAYDETAECPTFLAFAERVMPEDENRSFMQRYLGYCLTALTQEQVFVFLYGQGRNGKSTLVDLVCRMLGDYATTVPFETLAGDDRRKGSEATPDLVRVPGARLVRASEPETGMTFRESMVKSLTSGEPILIRRMREEFIEIYPTFKLIVSGNHKPNIKGADEGIWRRVLLFPFEIQIPKEEVDRALPEKLWAERSGILNWLLAGALSYLEDGLRVPQGVRAATEEYREASDAYGAFIRGALIVTGADIDTVTPGELYDAFRLFCGKQGFYPVGSTTFNKAMPDQASKHGFRKAKTNGLSVYRGVAIQEDFRPGASPSRTPQDDD